MHTQPTDTEGLKDWDSFRAASDDCEYRVARRKAAAYAAELSGRVDPRSRGASDDVIDAVIADARAWDQAMFGKRPAPVREAA